MQTLQAPYNLTGYMQIQAVNAQPYSDTWQPYRGYYAIQRYYVNLATCILTACMQTYSFCINT